MGIGTALSEHDLIRATEHGFRLFLNVQPLMCRQSVSRPDHLLGVVSAIVLVNELAQLNVGHSMSVRAKWQS